MLTLRSSQQFELTKNILDWDINEKDILFVIREFANRNLVLAAYWEHLLRYYADLNCSRYALRVARTKVTAKIGKGRLYSKVVSICLFICLGLVCRRRNEKGRHGDHGPFRFSR